MDWQWRDFLGKEVPADYLDELRGLAVRRSGLVFAGHGAFLWPTPTPNEQNGAASIGSPKAGAMVQRMIVLANAPGDCAALTAM